MHFLTINDLSNHTSGMSDLTPLHEESTILKVNWSSLDKLILFIRKMFGYETKKDDLDRLEQRISLSDSAKNPIELLNALKESLAIEMHNNVSIIINYSSDREVLKGIAIYYKSQYMEIETNDYNLMAQDREVIKKSDFYIFHIFDDTTQSTAFNRTREIIGDDFSNQIFNETFIKNKLDEILDKFSRESEDIQAEFRVRVIYNNEASDYELDKLIITDKGRTIFEIKPNANDFNIIMENLLGKIKIENCYTSCQYKQAVNALIEIDKSLTHFGSIESDYLVSSRVKLVNEIYNNVKKLGGSLSLNDITRSIDTESSINQESCGSLIKMALDVLESIKNKKLTAEDKELKIAQIKNCIDLIKYKISNQPYPSSDGIDYSVTYATQFTDRLESKISTSSGARKVELENTLSNANQLIEYCDSGNYEYIVDKQDLLVQERILKENKVFNSLYYWLIDNKEFSDQGLNSTSEVEALLLAYQGNNFINEGNQTISKFSDELYGFNPSLFIPRDLLNEYSAANKTLTEEIKSSLNLSLHNSEEFRTKAMDLLSKVHVMKSLFLDKYMKCFDAQRMSESQDMLTVFKTILNRIEQNKTIDEDKKHTWLLQANKRLLDEINRKIGASATIPE